jgi:hypothetical protein
VKKKKLVSSLRVQDNESEGEEMEERKKVAIDLLVVFIIFFQLIF